mmetsp:Transcript_39134/g.77500  ORF Transcript_39134/g.77500 Transcript_39134/m.77500 type:complete len:117 (-) Transcript_39134:330-680(-)
MQYSTTVLSKGANMFVRREYSTDAVNAIASMQFGQFFSSHLVVELEAVDHVINLAESLEGEKVRYQEFKCKIVSLECPNRFPVKGTFIDIPMPNMAGPKTASTTDVDPRRGKNPRL